MTITHDLSAAMTMEAYHEALRELAHEKRFLEKWSSDPAFRQALTDNMEETLDARGLRLDMGELNSIVAGGASAVFDRLQTLAYLKMMWTNRFYHEHCQPADAAWQQWRVRQINRQVLDLGPHHAMQNIHSSLAVELNKGCSVGCWFCALSPDKKSVPLDYHSGGRETFHALITALQHELGSAVDSGFLYWGTEPMDNPDYEQYCVDFHTITGTFPPTTTAVAHKHPERIKNLLDLAAKHGSWLTRFSVLTTSLMDRIHAAYTPEELALAECLPLNREADYAYGVAGRYRDYLQTHPEAAAEQRAKLRRAPWYDSVKEYLNDDTHAHGSIACVTGFLVNTVDRTISLIAPVTADDANPLGYITFAQAEFTSPDDIPATIADVVTRGRRLVLADSDICAIPAWVSTQIDDDALVVTGRIGGKARRAHHGNVAAMDALVNALRQGTYSRADVIRTVAASSSIDAAWVSDAIDGLWKLGVLVEPVSV